MQDEDEKEKHENKEEEEGHQMKEEKKRRSERKKKMSLYVDKTINDCAGSQEAGPQEGPSGRHPQCDVGYSGWCEAGSTGSSPLGRLL